jgi:hypothetical protein
MLSTGFADAPVSRSLAYGIVAASILASVTDVKHYFYIQVDPHLWRYHQLWRIFTYQLCYTNSTEVLFAAMTIYNMRVIERLWGSRKYAVSHLQPSGSSIANISVVFRHSQLLLRDPPTTHASRLNSPTPLLEQLQLHPRRMYAPYICHSGTIPRSDSTRL